MKDYNEAITTLNFLNILKHTNTRSVYKKDSRNKVHNYYPMSILINLSKVYGKCLFNEMVIHFDDILSKYQCGFRKGFSSQQCLIVLQKFKHKGGSFAAIAIDLLKAFGCFLHGLLIAKLFCLNVSLKPIYT